MKTEKHVLVAQPRLWIRGCSRLADELGVTRSHLSMIMHGTRRPGRRLAARLRAMGVEWPMDEAAPCRAGKEVAQ